MILRICNCQFLGIHLHLHLQTNYKNKYSPTSVSVLTVNSSETDVVGVEIGIAGVELGIVDEVQPVEIAGGAETSTVGLKAWGAFLF